MQQRGNLSSASSLSRCHPKSGWAEGGVRSCIWIQVLESSCNCFLRCNSRELHQNWGSWHKNWSTKGGSSLIYVTTQAPSCSEQCDELYVSSLTWDIEAPTFNEITFRDRALGNWGQRIRMTEFCYERMNVLIWRKTRKRSQSLTLLSYHCSLLLGSSLHICVFSNNSLDEFLPSPIPFPFTDFPYIISIVQFFISSHNSIILLFQCILTL